MTQILIGPSTQVGERCFQVTDRTVDVMQLVETEQSDSKGLIVGTLAAFQWHSRSDLQSSASEFAAIVNVRNAGLMIGIELDRPCAELVKLALSNKLLINVTAEKVIRLLPPLVINKSEAQELVNRLVPVIESFLQAAQQNNG